MGVLDYGLFGHCVSNGSESLTGDEDTIINVHPRRHTGPAKNPTIEKESALIENDDVDRLHYASAPGASMRMSVSLKSFGGQFQQLLVKSILARVLQTQLLLPSQFAQRRSALA
jgi:hypothetical protein